MSFVTRGKSHKRDVSKTNKVVPMKETQNSQSMHKSAWDRAREKYEEENKQKKVSTAKPFIVDESADRDYNSPGIINFFKSKKFRNPKFEKLYQRYFFNLSQNNLKILMAVYCVICILLMLFYYLGGVTFPSRGVTLGIISGLFIILEILSLKNVCRERQLFIFSYIVILLQFGIVITISVDNEPTDAINGVWCVMFFVYMIYALMPVRMRVALTSAVCICIVHTICVTIYNKHLPYFWKQVRYSTV